MVGQLHSHKGYNQCTEEISVPTLFFFPVCSMVFSSHSLFFVEAENRLLCEFQDSYGTSKETWDLILSQTLCMDQEKLSPRREEAVVPKNSSLLYGE